MDCMMRLLQRLILVIGMITLGIYALIERAGVKITVVGVVYSIVFFILAFLLMQWLVKILKKVVSVGELEYFRTLKAGAIFLGMVSIVQLLSALIQIDKECLWITFVSMGGMYALVYTYNRRMIKVNK